MTDLDALRARAEALRLHGLVAHWPEVATQNWVAPLLDWEEQQRACRSEWRALAGHASPRTARTAGSDKRRGRKIPHNRSDR